MDFQLYKKVWSNKKIWFWIIPPVQPSVGKNNLYNLGATAIIESYRTLKLPIWCLNFNYHCVHVVPENIYTPTTEGNSRKLPSFLEFPIF